MKDRDRLEQLIAEYRQRIVALETALVLLDEAAPRRGKGGRVAAAIAMDARRRADTNGNGGAPPKHSAAAYHRPEATKARRARTAAFLATLDRTDPRPGAGGPGLGMLVRRGYIKKKGDGYIRTAKEFIV